MDAECAEAFWGKALAAAQCATGEELAAKRLAIQPTKTETLTACEKDQERLSAGWNKYPRIPTYFEDKDITSIYSFEERTFPSETEAWKAHIADEKSYWQSDRQLSRAVRYAKGELADTLTGLRGKIDHGLRDGLEKSVQQDMNTAEAVKKRYAEALDVADRRLDEAYQNAVQRRRADYERYCRQQAQAKTEAEFNAAAENFEQAKMKGFEDCDARAKQCRTEAERLDMEACARAKAAVERQRLQKEAEDKARREKKKKIIFAAAALAVIIAAVLIVSKVVIPANNYKAAEALLAAGDYDGAIAKFESLVEYGDAESRISETNQKARYYENGLSYLEQRNLYMAKHNFELAGDYKDAEQLVQIIEELERGQ